MNWTDFLLSIISALLALNLAQITGMRNDLKRLTERVNEHDAILAGVQKVFELNGCELPDQNCRH